MLRDFFNFFSLVPLRTPTLPPATHTNCVIVGHRRAVIVDPGSPYPMEIQHLERAIQRLLSRGGSLAGVLLTHHHGDHVGGAEAVARRHDLPLWAHRETLDLLPGLSGIPVETVEEGRTVWHDGDRQVVALHTPGHAPGHLCLWQPEERILVAGDVVAGKGTVVIDPPQGDMALYFATLQRLAQLNPETIIPAHGDPLPDGKRALKTLLNHRRERERKVLISLDKTARDLLLITRQAYDDTPALLWPLASRSALAHLLKLQAEGEASQLGSGWVKTT